MNRSLLAAVVSLALLPLVWLWPCVAGQRLFVPYDIAQFPPVATVLDPAELAAARAGANFDVTEVPVWLVPELELAQRELAAGRWPVWNPHARSGAPLHATGVLGLFHPSIWLALLAPRPERALALVAWCNLAIGGLLALGLFRRLGLSPAAAWFGAVVFELSGPMAANAFFWMRLGSFVWLPGILWALVHLSDQERARPLPVAALAAAFAMPWLAGFPPYAAAGTAFAGLAAAWLIADCWRRLGRRAALRRAAAFAAGFGFGACLALPQVLPSLLFFPLSARPTTPAFADIANQAFETYGLLGYLAPGAFGHPTLAAELPYSQSPVPLLWNTRRGADGGPALPNYNFTEYTVTVAAIGALLAALGAVTGRGRHRWLAVAALALALGLAMFAPGLRLLFQLPLVQHVWPLRWPAAATVFVAWLAAAGLERLLGGARRPALITAAAALGAAAALWLLTAMPRRAHSDPGWAANALAAHYGVDAAAAVAHVTAGAPAGFDRFTFAFDRLAAEGRGGALWLALGALLLAGFGCAAGSRSRHLLALAAAGATVAQLGPFGASLLRGTAAAARADTAVHEFLRARAAAAASDGGFAIARGSRAPALPSMLPPGQLMAPGVRDLHFYTHYDARSLAPIRAVLGAALGEELGARIADKGHLTAALPPAVLQHPLFDLVGLRYVLAVEPLPEVGPVVGPEWRGPQGAFYIHERPGALPRAFTVPAVVALADDEAVVRALAAADLAPRRQAFVVASEFPAPLPVEPPPLEPPPRGVTVVRDEPGHLELDVAAGTAPFLVVTDTWLPGWSACIDGEPVPLRRANHSQRLVALPARACRVSCRYHTPGLLPGLGLAGLAAAALALWWIATRRGGAATAAG